ncbi:DUF1289 domain-containing protein [Oceanicoccus sp. KOV_DT_Chl]|uniref:DUF1289 domain-containing protein n=1 Tax=Oceanicoccus sp. KOV_DT_Chl TaxID=1904639 RepID=UPI000C79B1DD|nr:DUF1289 domain-containing protein [Oceanicoccus sp. KOV_DT_Chl]
MGFSAELITNNEADKNPCVRNCCLDDGNICMGCGRSLPEILEWHQADYPRQKQISRDAKHRLNQRPKFK